MTEDERLAHNFLDTLGPSRAKHAAKAYCWRGVMDELDRIVPEESPQQMQPQHLHPASPQGKQR